MLNPKETENSEVFFSLYTFIFFICIVDFQHFALRCVSLLMFLVLKLQFSMLVVSTKYTGCIRELFCTCSYQSFMQTIMNISLFLDVCTVVVLMYTDVHTVLNTKSLMNDSYVIGPGTPLYLCLSLYSYVAFYSFLPT